MLLPVSHEEGLRMESGMMNSSSSSATSSRSSSFNLGEYSRSKGRSSRISSKSGSGIQVFRTCSAFPEYFARILDYKQMDLDATFYQMVTLCVHPSKVYKSAYYRKQTKNRWARDDPAFAVIQLLFLIVATVAWAVAFKVSKLSTFMVLLLHAIVIEWLGFGLFIATVSWWLANEYLRLRENNAIGDTFFVEQHVEWQFAFDIHCNSFFIMFLFDYVLQFLLIPFLVSDSFLSLFVANIIYSCGWGLYVYITFLGYMALPFLHHTERFLYPLVFIIALFLSSLILYLFFGTNLNLAKISTGYYY